MLNIAFKSRMDYENFLCTLLIPKKFQKSAFAVRAFNVELAQIRDAVNDKQIGKARMLFWRDCLEQVYKGQPPQHPVAMALTEAVEKHNLSKRWFTRLIDARETNLEDKPHQDIKSLEDYNENSVSSVLYLILESSGIKDVHADHAASHIGKAIGIVTLLRAAPYLANQRKVYIPSDILIKHEVSHQDVIRGNASQSLKDVVYELASTANTHMSTARSFQSKVPKAAIKTLLPGVSCQNYLDKVQKADFNMFDNSLRERNNLLPLQLLKQVLKGKY
ncbi:NADH dehydrogenase (ubiquinone) complex I, assembly factor 6 [Exaiptasia diaphana]|nr:NADH dehydrogenase (ubiquinone) complex I, assembly factor 6 [Exaiptasia diaphana]